MHDHKIELVLTDEEFQALESAAVRNLRTPEGQIRYWLHEAAGIDWEAIVRKAFPPQIEGPVQSDGDDPEPEEKPDLNFLLPPAQGDTVVEKAKCQIYLLLMGDTDREYGSTEIMKVTKNPQARIYKAIAELREEGYLDARRNGSANLYRPSDAMSNYRDEFLKSLG